MESWLLLVYCYREGLFTIPSGVTSTLIIVILVDRAPPSLLLSTGPYVSAAQQAGGPAGSELPVTPVKLTGAGGASSSSRSKRFITLSDNEDTASETPSRRGKRGKKETGVITRAEQEKVARAESLTPRKNKPVNIY